MEIEKGKVLVVRIDGRLKGTLDRSQLEQAEAAQGGYNMCYVTERPGEVALGLTVITYREWQEIGQPDGVYEVEDFLRKVECADRSDPNVQAMYDEICVQ